MPGKAHHLVHLIEGAPAAYTPCGYVYGAILLIHDSSTLLFHAEGNAIQCWQYSAAALNLWFAMSLPKAAIRSHSSLEHTQTCVHGLVVPPGGPASPFKGHNHGSQRDKIGLVVLAKDRLYRLSMKKHIDTPIKRLAINLKGLSEGLDRTRQFQISMRVGLCNRRHQDSPSGQFLQE